MDYQGSGYQADHRGQSGSAFWGLIVMGFSAVINWVISSLLMKTAQESDSVALEADAWHLRTDVYTSVGVAGDCCCYGSQVFNCSIP